MINQLSIWDRSTTKPFLKTSVERFPNKIESHQFFVTSKNLILKNSQKIRRHPKIAKIFIFHSWKANNKNLGKYFWRHLLRTGSNNAERYLVRNLKNLIKPIHQKWVPGSCVSQSCELICSAWSSSQASGICLAVVKRLFGSWLTASGQLLRIYCG